MNRRQLLKAGVSAGTGALFAGCTGYEEHIIGTESTESEYDPEEVMQQFLDAVAAGDRDTAESLIHPDGELAEQADQFPTDEDSIEFESVHVETVAEDETEAFVEVEAQFQNESGEEITSDELYELHSEGERWRIYGRPNNVPLRFRLEGVTPADSFETTIGFTESGAEFFFSAEDAAAVDKQDYYQDDDIVLVSLSFADEKAEQMEQTATELNSDLGDAQIFEYLDEELIREVDLGDDLAQTILAGDWIQQPAFNLSYTDRDLAARVAKTVLTQADE